MQPDDLFDSNFRRSDAVALKQLLDTRRSILIIGIKRVGISNFLRFLLFDTASQKNLQSYKSQLIVYLDLNKLVERDIYPFWTLLLKRLVEVCTPDRVGEEIAKEGRHLFNTAIQLKDLQVTVDNIRALIELLTKRHISLTLVLNRFDRLWDVASPALLSNLSSLRDLSDDTLAFICTSFRPLTLFPKLRGEQLGFMSEYYFLPAKGVDALSLVDLHARQFNLKLTDTAAETVAKVSGGHAQYARILIGKKLLPREHEKEEKFIERAGTDEEVQLLSEEIYKNLNEAEQSLLISIARQDFVSNTELEKSQYLTKTGMVQRTKTLSIFSPMFEFYLKHLGSSHTSTIEFTKKEKLLFAYLHKHEGIVCERDAIIEAVWPEQAESGVSDWAIDRLVARVRAKLKKQKSHFEIVTVITRGYKLISK